MRAVPRFPPVLIAGLSLLVLMPTSGLKATSPSQGSAVAVFPVQNLSGVGVPADDIRQALAEGVASRGVRVLGSDALDAFMKRHRVRYAAGVDVTTGAALREETGVSDVVIASVGLSSEAIPPKVALTARLVSLQATPVVVWGDDVGLAGDDAPGFFELGIVNDYDRLLGRAVDRLTDSLAAYLTTGSAESHPKRARKFGPKVFYGTRSLEAGKRASLAVLPFHNASPRRNAGDILALLFVRHLSSLPEFQVLDVGVVRQELLNARIIMDAGPSITDAETLAALLEADFVLGGRVLSYVDHEGPGAVPRVEFSTVMIERRSRKVVWASDSYNDGGDGVLFFDRGRSRTAHVMATQMVRLTAERIAAGGR